MEWIIIFLFVIFIIAIRNNKQTEIQKKNTSEKIKRECKLEQEKHTIIYEEEPITDYSKNDNDEKEILDEINNSFIAIDFETATGKRYSACQLGIILVEKGSIVKKESFLIQPPENEYSQVNIAIHGISEKHTIDKPTFKDLWPCIREYINHYTIVCHSQSFDIDVLRKTCEYYSITDLNIQNVHCTYEMTGLALIEVCQGLGIPVSGHHDAQADAEMCANVFLKLESGSVVDHSLIKVHKGGKKENDKELVKAVSNTNTNFFDGKRTIITGVFGAFSRDDLKNILSNLGAELRGGITSKTEIVIVGMDAGPSKVAKIKELQENGSKIIVLNEEQLKEKIKFNN